MANNNEIIEQLFMAIDAIATKKLEKVKFDKSIIGTITNNSGANYGRYQVTTDNNIRFTVYSDITTFSIGEKVYVRIPDNDYTKQKVIIGRYIPENQNTIISEIKSNQIELLKNKINDLAEKQAQDCETIKESYTYLINEDKKRIKELEVLVNEQKKYIKVLENDINLIKGKIKNL